MKIRIQGTEEECRSFAKDMKKIYDVRSISAFYANRRNNQYSNEGRLYCEICSRVRDNRA